LKKKKNAYVHNSGGSTGRELEIERKIEESEINIFKRFCDVTLDTMDNQPQHTGSAHYTILLFDLANKYL
jgi:hypothetical protein